MKLIGRKIMGGNTKGVVLASKSSISFFGGVDPQTGIIVEPGHELEGMCIKDKVLVFPTGKGSTVGSYILYRLKKNKVAPAGIVNRDCEPIIAVGCIISDIPCIDHVDLQGLKTGDMVEMNADNYMIEIINHE